jgi:16S rRNA processing protein RimM
VPTSEESSAEKVTVARVLRPQGRRGEVAAEILTDFPERLTKLTSAYLWDGRTEPRLVNVRGCWLSQSRGGQAVFHFEGSDSISDAERLVGLEVQIPLSERMPLPGGSYYVTDLIGCEVRDEAGGAIGRVRDVQFTGEDTPGTPLLVIDTPEGELLVPLAQDICVHVDLTARSIDVKLPEGLRDLNR